MIRLAPFLFFYLTGCTEYGLQGDDDTTAPADDDATLEEVCNGVDDDLDGLIDEGYLDSDGDGIADCTDDDCDVEIPAAGEVEILESCTGEIPGLVSEPWDVVVEARYPFDDVQMAPAVGHLTDDNGDGLYGPGDVPDIVFCAGTVLRAIQGDGSGEVFSASGYSGSRGVAIADIDQDGVPEILAVDDHTETVEAVDNTGQRIWIGPIQQWAEYPQPTVADVDGDGDVEVVAGLLVIDACTGQTEVELTWIYPDWHTPVLADLDGDGTAEIIVGDKVSAHNGASEWSSSADGLGMFAAVANLDGDLHGEVVFATRGHLNVHDDDGSVLGTFELPGSEVGPPAIADFDGDGEPEVAVPATSVLSVWDMDGTMLWSSEIVANGYAGCSGFDLDADGAAEVLYADAFHFRIFDGATGDVLFEDADHAAESYMEYPVVADVDADGEAEILVASSGSPNAGITVYGHDGPGWAPVGQTWPIHDFAAGMIGDDGTVPIPIPQPWHEHNLFRAAPVSTEPARPDLVLVEGETCVASCDHGPVKVSYGLANQGAADVASAVGISLYAVHGESEEWIDTHFHGPIAAGQVLEGDFFQLDPGQWGDGVILRADDEGSGEGQFSECDEGNNELPLLGVICQE